MLQCKYRRTKMSNLKVFENKKARTEWDAEKEDWLSVLPMYVIFYQIAKQKIKMLIGEN